MWLYSFTFLSLFLTSCTTHVNTFPVCDNSLYVEVQYCDNIEVAKEFLTDSATFRLYIGTRDVEHENISYTCIGDSVCIKELVIDDISGGFREKSVKYFMLRDLRTGKIEKYK